MDGAPTIYVVARYWTERAYGGPEEGGWWYTVGELEKVVLATRDEERAYAAARRLNGWVADEQRHVRRAVSYDVVEIPRRELLPELKAVACHADYEFGENDYEVRWDIPAYYPEGRPHYC